LYIIYLNGFSPEKRIDFKEAMQQIEKLLPLRKRCELGG